MTTVREQIIVAVKAKLDTLAGVTIKRNRALGRYGVKNFLTIGTAGSLTRKLPVGTIFTPEKFDNGNNQFEPIKVISPIAGVPVVGNYPRKGRQP